MNEIRVATPGVVRASLASAAMQKQMAAMITDPKKRNQMASSMVAMVQQTPTLQECEVGSLFNTSMAGAAIDLPYGFGYWFAVPYNKKKTETTPAHKQAQFQMGYKGFIQLALRSGQYSKIIVKEIKEGEIVEINSLTETYKFKALETNRKQAKTIGYYALFVLQNGFIKEDYWTYDEMMEHADTYSQAFKKVDYLKILDGKIAENMMWKYSSFWYKNFDEMAKKTILKLMLSKWGILSIELQQAITKDQASIKDDNTIDYVDNQETTHGYKTIEQLDKPTEFSMDDIPEKDRKFEE